MNINLEPNVNYDFSAFTQQGQCFIKSSTLEISITGEESDSPISFEFKNASVDMHFFIKQEDGTYSIKEDQMFNIKFNTDNLNIELKDCTVIEPILIKKLPGRGFSAAIKGTVNRVLQSPFTND